MKPDSGLMRTHSLCEFFPSKSGGRLCTQPRFPSFHVQAAARRCPSSCSFWEAALWHGSRMVLTGGCWSLNAVCLYCSCSLGLKTTIWVDSFFSFLSFFPPFSFTAVKLLINSNHFACVVTHFHKHTLCKAPKAVYPGRRRASCQTNGCKVTRGWISRNC